MKKRQEVKVRLELTQTWEELGGEIHKSVFGTVEKKGQAGRPDAGAADGRDERWRRDGVALN